MAEHRYRRRLLDIARQVATLLPRFVPGHRRAAPGWNAVTVLASAASGAALVHIRTFHLLATTPGPRWGTTALALLAHCPLFGPLGLIAAIAVLAPLLAFGEILRLERLPRRQQRGQRRVQAPLPATYEAMPRSA